MQQFTEEMKASIAAMSDDERDESLLSLAQTIDALAAAFEVPTSALVATARASDTCSLRKLLLSRLIQVRAAEKE